ncbi:ATP-dependent DNA helicase [Oleispirillum naphthae]|uniref:ATP-dependent DNA helicase n=1 Tax=Oleispirillum naphthae TaxID=2838853 RepID=UPI003082390E
MSRRVVLPRAPALAVTLGGLAWMDAEGEVATPAPAEAARLWKAAPAYVCHRVWVAQRLGCEPPEGLDLLELFAFVFPARFAVPTIAGLADALELPPPGEDPADQALALLDAARVLLGTLARLPDRERLRAKDTALPMAKGGWPWGAAALGALTEESDPPPPEGARGLRVWERLKEWEDAGPPPPAGCAPVGEAETRQRLAALLGTDAEQRPSQADYAAGLAHGFAPREAADSPNAVLAEAGTGVGKTLGYIAPASLWAEKNGGPVWISTYTRNLQRQLDGELSRLYPDPAEKARHVVVRRGRENILCLLNLEDALARAVRAPRGVTAIGLVARWAEATRDGAMIGGDFPGWLVHLLGRVRTVGLTDQRGECLHAGCAHYGRCFVEKSVRRARHARIVIANHALVMAQAALGGLDDSFVPNRYVFDEGHHVFDAADSAFSAHLTGREAHDLRRWVLGGEDSMRGGVKSRARGLQRRAEELVAGHAEAETALAALGRAARALPAAGWESRLGGRTPHGPVEAFLLAVQDQVLARAEEPEGLYSLETAPAPLADAVAETLPALDNALFAILGPARGLAAILRRRLSEEVESLEAAMRQRMEATARTLEHRALQQVAAWRAMLKDLSGATPAEYADWFGIERIEGRNIDLGFYRHWIDPTIPFAQALAESAHGMVVTSATLRDAGDGPEGGWAAAALAGGAGHFPTPALRIAVPSPFDYAAQTRVFIVHDLGRAAPAPLAAAMQGLFSAAGGGALGLFTAIQRLKEVHARIKGPLAAAGIDLLAQHVDGLDTTTLIDLFRAEENACLLGTDAVRDGVDVPGRSLRLIAFDRVPWPRPGILYRARREAFGGTAYTDRLTRMKLRQAFGRLIRRADDRGVFVLLAPLPSRLLSAFPEGVTAERVGIAEAIAATRDFLRN